MKIEVCKIERRDKKPVRSEHNTKKGLTVVAIPALIVIGVVFYIIGNKDSWLTKSTIQRKAMPANQCQKTDDWFLDETGKLTKSDGDATGLLITSGEEEYIITRMEYFYKKTGVQPFIWVGTFADEINHIAYLDRGEAEDNLMIEKYDELFGSDGGHVLIALSRSVQFSTSYFWICYPGDNARSQVMDDEAVQILLDCLRYIINSLVFLTSLHLFFGV